MHARSDRHLDGSLRTQHERLAIVQQGREPEQVVSAGTPAVQRQDRREGAIARWNVRGVEQIHDRERG